MVAPSIEVLYADEDVAVVLKPSGLLVHRGGMAREDDVAMVRARHVLGRQVYTVHRLDRATSGALLLALSSEMAALLSRAFEAGTIEKTYIALVRGVLPEQIVVDHPVPKDEGGERVPAVTALRRLWEGPHCSLVEARPMTGRFHQIRRHLKHLHHPIVGDTNYGDGATNRRFRADFGLTRLALHASRLVFSHPRSGARIDVPAAIPEDLAEPLRKLGVESQPPIE